MSVRIVANLDGSTTDQETGLIWSPLLGVDPLGNIIRNGTELSWNRATDLFGQARTLKGSIKFSDHNAQEKQLSPEAYSGYVFGREKLSLCGADDWRLPTAEEFWTLVDGRTPVSRALGEDWMTHVWTANGWDGERSFASIFMGGFPEIAGDINRSSLAKVRLVRGGDIFQRQAFPSSAFKQQRRDRVLFETAPFTLVAPLASFVTSYQILNGEVAIRKSFFGFSFGNRPKVPVAQVTRSFPRGAIWGDIVFCDSSGEAVVWTKVFRPEATLRRVQEVMQATLKTV